MSRNGDVNVAVHGDASDALDAFDDVSAGARDMAKDIDRSTEDSSDGFDKLGDGVDGAEGKFRGFGDTIGGTSDIMQGFKDGNLVGMAMGFADLAGGISDFVLPAITAMRSAIMTGLAPALTAISAHPLIAGILAGGAIIAGLIILEKKFGLVSKAVDVVKDSLGAVLEGLGGIIRGFRDMWNETVGGKGFTFGGVDLPGPVDIPGINLRIPRLHSGGVNMGGGEMLTILQGGERVIPAGSGRAGTTIIVQGSLIHERELPELVARAGLTAALQGVTF